MVRILSSKNGFSAKQKASWNPLLPPLSELEYLMSVRYLSAASSSGSICSAVSGWFCSAPSQKPGMPSPLPLLPTTSKRCLKRGAFFFSSSSFITRTFSSNSSCIASVSFCSCSSCSTFLRVAAGSCSSVMSRRSVPLMPIAAILRASPAGSSSSSSSSSSDDS